MWGGGVRSGRGVQVGGGVRNIFLGGWGLVLRGGGQGGCERRIEVFGKNHKKKIRGGGGGLELGGQGGCA